MSYGSNLLLVIGLVLFSCSVNAEPYNSKTLNAIVKVCVTQMPFVERVSSLTSDGWKDVTDDIDVEQVSSILALVELSFTVKESGELTPAGVRAFESAKRTLAFQMEEPIKPFIEKAILQTTGTKPQSFLFIRQFNDSHKTVSCMASDTKEVDEWFVSKLRKMQALKNKAGIWRLPNFHNNDVAFSSSGHAIWIEAKILTDIIAPELVPEMLFHSFTIYRDG